MVSIDFVLGCQVRMLANLSDPHLFLLLENAARRISSLRGPPRLNWLKVTSALLRSSNPVPDQFDSVEFADLSQVSILCFMHGTSAEHVYF
jgi:hypothetical protein